MITIIATTNPLEPNKRQILALPLGSSIRQCLHAVELDDGGPTIVAINGDWWLQARWNDALPTDATVEIRRLLAGGGGQGKGRVVSAAMIVAGAALVIGSGGTMTAAGWGLIAGGAAGLASSLLVQRPDVPTPLQGDSGQASPTYSASGGNRRRVGDPIPVVHGRMRVVPDLVGESWSEFENDQQVLCMLLCLGHGSFSFNPATDLRLADADLASFAGSAGIDVVATGGSPVAGRPVSVQVLEPGDSVSLWRSPLTNTAQDVVTTSAVVQGQDLAPSGDWVGPFPANPAGTTCQEIGVDVVCGRGLFNAGAAVTVAFEIQARPISEAGGPLGGFYFLGAPTITGATTSAIRRSYRYAVPASFSRWEVRVRRTSGGGGSATRADASIWSSLRGYLLPVLRYPKVRPGATDPAYPVTLLAVRIQATDRVTGDVAQRLAAIVTRKVPTWTGSAWSAAIATRNPAWAFADLARNPVYGAGLPNSRLDLTKIKSLADAWDALEDRCDSALDSTITRWEGLTRLARSGRATPVLVGGVLTLVRDEPRTITTCVFTPSTMIRGSWRNSYMLRRSSDPDGIRLAWTSPADWTVQHIETSPSGVTPIKPNAVDLFGVTDEGQARREALYLAGQLAYQRRPVTWLTERDGHLPQIGDLVAVPQDVPAFGQSSILLNAAGTRLTLSEPPIFTTGTHYVGLRRRDGTLSGPYVATAVAGQPDQIDLDASPDFTPVTDLSICERTSVLFGPGDAWRVRVVVTQIRPNGSDRVELTGMIYDPRTYGGDRRIIYSASATTYSGTIETMTGDQYCDDNDLMPNGDPAFRYT